MRSKTEVVREAIADVLSDLRETRRGDVGDAPLVTWDSILALHELYDRACSVQGYSIA